MDSLPFARVEFVTPKDGTVRTGTDISIGNFPSTEGRSCMTGDEAKRFYEGLLREPSDTKERAGQRIMKSNSVKAREKCKVATKVEKTLPDLNSKDVNQYMRAAAENDLSTVNRYLSSGMAIDTVDVHGWTALMCAAYGGCLDTVAQLRASGADLNLRNRKGQTAADLATVARHFLISHFLNTQIQLEPEPEGAEDEVGGSSEGIEKFCNSCQLPYSECSHPTSTVHLLSTKTPVQDPGYGIRPSNKGYQLLKKYGWNEYSGLGKSEEGKRYPIKTVLKRDRKGLGSHKEKPRVTHFGPNDEQAVTSIPNSRRSVRLKSKLEMKREGERKRQKQRRFESEFRRQFHVG